MEPLDLSAFISHRGNGAARMDLAIEGIDCAACIQDIETGLKDLPGLLAARLNFTTHRLAIEWREGLLDPAAILGRLRHLGYKAYPYSRSHLEDAESSQSQWLIRCLAVAGFAAMNIMLLSVSVWSGNVSDISQETRDLFHWISALIALPAATYAGQPFFQSAWRALSRRAVNMDVPISLGVILALGMSLYETVHHAEHAYFDSATMLLFFLLCGRVTDHLMRRRTRALAGNLAALKAEMANRLSENDDVSIVPAIALKQGEKILVRPGERVAADGRILSGQSAMDEALITGETLPRSVQKGDVVYAGCVNLTGALSIEVQAAGANTLIDEIERLVSSAFEGRSRYVQLADRAARLYAPVVHATAALTCLGWLMTGHSLHDSLITAIAVLIITCPCALALAVPAVQVVATGTLFHQGLLINKPDAFERLAETDVIVFDKTGTLTLPEPVVANAEEIERDLLEIAGKLAFASQHPLARAVAHHIGATSTYETVTEQKGSGVEAVVNGHMARLGSLEFCGIDAGQKTGSDSLIGLRHGERTAVLHIEQSLRPDAIDVINRLQNQGYDVRILSGDREEAVRSIAGKLQIRYWQAGCKPADKIRIIEQLKASNRNVLMVGDGMNDAPALAAASVSMSPITAAHISQAQADALFLGAALKPVESALSMARTAHHLMRQNLWLSVIYNLLAVPLAVVGHVTPLIAALAMSGSSILVTLNALRARWGGTA